MEVGAGFGVGIHNVPEAAVWGVPVIFGPNNKRFQEAQDLLASGACFEVKDYDSFALTMSHLLATPDAISECGRKSEYYVTQRAGTTEAIMSSVGL